MVIPGLNHVYSAKIRIEDAQTAKMNPDQLKPCLLMHFLVSMRDFNNQKLMKIVTCVVFIPQEEVPYTIAYIKVTYSSNIYCFSVVVDNYAEHYKSRRVSNKPIIFCFL